MIRLPKILANAKIRNVQDSGGPRTAFFITANEPRPTANDVKQGIAHVGRSLRAAIPFCVQCERFQCRGAHVGNVSKFRKFINKRTPDTCGGLFVCDLLSAFMLLGLSLRRCR